MACGPLMTGYTAEVALHVKGQGRQAGETVQGLGSNCGLEPTVQGPCPALAACRIACLVITFPLLLLPGRSVWTFPSCSILKDLGIFLAHLLQPTDTESWQAISLPTPAPHGGHCEGASVGDSGCSPGGRRPRTLLLSLCTRAVGLRAG